MTHTLPLNEPFEVADIDCADDGISVVVAGDMTIEFCVTDHTNMGDVKFSAMTSEQARDFAQAIMSAADHLDTVNHEPHTAQQT